MRGRLTGWIDVQLDRLNMLYAAGRITDMEKIFQYMRPLIDHGVDAEHRVRYHHSLPTMIHRRDRFVTSGETLFHGEAQLEAARSANSPRLVAEARFSLGFLLLWKREGTRAEPNLQASLKWAETTGDLLLWVRSLLYLSFLRRQQGDVEAVRTISSQTLQLAQRAGYNEYIASVLAHRAWVALRKGHSDQARCDALEALQLWDKGNLVYPFQWAAIWPLLAVKLHEGREAASFALVERLLSPEQHRLDQAIESRLSSALTAWRENRADDAFMSLREAVTAAQEAGYV